MKELINKQLLTTRSGCVKAVTVEGSTLRQASRWAHCLPRGRQYSIRSQPGPFNINPHPKVSTVKASKNKVVKSAERHTSSAREGKSRVIKIGLALESENGVWLPSVWPCLSLSGPWFPSMFCKNNAYLLAHLKGKGAVRKRVGGRPFQTERKTGSWIEVRRKSIMAHNRATVNYSLLTITWVKCPGSYLAH